MSIETTIIVALIAAVPGIIASAISVINMRHLKAIEIEKRAGEIVMFRYEKLWNLLDDIVKNKSQLQIYFNDGERTIVETIEKRPVFISFYHQLCTLVEAPIRKDLETIASEEMREIDKLVEKRLRQEPNI
ncbi:MAG: hypothetical protein FWE32_03620 [Oscillospiraceae bacterium]|nr:hypothetical protein [Oscillospiraceae bacterium]